MRGKSRVCGQLQLETDIRILLDIVVRWVLRSWTIDFEGLFLIFLYCCTVSSYSCTVTWSYIHVFLDHQKNVLSNSPSSKILLSLSPISGLCKRPPLHTNPSLCRRSQLHLTDNTMTTEQAPHSHDGLSPHSHSHSHEFSAAEHGHSHEILDGPGSYTLREMPIVTGRDWSERAFTVGIGG